VSLPKIYVNGFPKSGLHFAELMVSSIFSPLREYNWLGTNAWKADKKEQHLDVLAVVKEGQYLKAHSGYGEKLSSMLIGLEFGMVFVYRDLRDVTVSLAYHILSDDPDLLHPARDRYPKDLHGVMKAVITGLDEYIGIVEKWKDYQPWLYRPRVFPVRYEDMVRKPEQVTSRFFDFVYGLAADFSGRDEITVSAKDKQTLCTYMVKRMKNKKTTTFRKGKLRQWKREFTPELVELFKQHDPDNVLMKLGFEKNKDWH